MANSCVLDQNKINLKVIFAQSNVYNGEEIDDKPIVLKYLKSFSPLWITSVRVMDNISKTIIQIADNSYSDGIFQWDERDIYHFEKYNMPLNKDFIKHCLKNAI